jgi:ribosome recycling factor
MVQPLITAAKPKMEGAIAHFLEELKTLRTGRASASMLDSVVVSYYGTMTPLKGLATIAVPEPSQIVIQPFDASSIKDIREAIIQADLGLNPSDDGRSLRLVVPPPTAERREELVKKAGKIAEEARISIRSIRGNVWEEVQAMQKRAEISEDNRDYGRAEIDKLTAEYNKKVEELLKEKEKDIRTV